MLLFFKDGVNWLTFLMLQKNSISNKWRFHKNIKQQDFSALIIDVSWAEKQQIRLLSYYVTLKTGVMMLKMQLWSQK